MGVPKTIDNDILLMDRTFGFDTAVEEAQKAIHSAYIEVYFLTWFSSRILRVHDNIYLVWCFELSFCHAGDQRIQWRRHCEIDG